MDEIIDLDNMTVERMRELVREAVGVKDAFHAAVLRWLNTWAYVRILGPYTEQQERLQEILKEAQDGQDK